MVMPGEDPSAANNGADVGAPFQAFAAA